MHITDVWCALQRLQRATKSTRARTHTHFATDMSGYAQCGRSAGARPVLGRVPQAGVAMAASRRCAAGLRLPLPHLHRDRGHPHELSRCSAGCYIAEAWVALTLIVLALMAETAQRQLTIASLVGLPVFFAVGYGGSYLTRMLTIRQARPLGMHDVPRSRQHAGDTLHCDRATWQRASPPCGSHNQ
jgi:hypothetical protein